MTAAVTDPIREAQRRLISALGGISTSTSARYSKRKIIHDPIWGTCKYQPWEVSLLELDVFQRLRGLKQTGFAYFTYPSAEHSRFQHTLGVVEAASQIFDSIFDRLLDGGLSPRGLAERQGHALFRKSPDQADIRRKRTLLRLAALVHDTGHSVFSHSSERIYALIPPFPELQNALTTSTGKSPGAAEIVVYLMVTSPEWKSAADYLWSGTDDPPPSTAEWEQIGRWIMGQEENPDEKFLADIISGPFDADKLDYVFRDGYAAGIPVGYDLERLVSTVCADPQKSQIDNRSWWRLTLPIRGINALEQLVMGRLVLTSYLYHHHKCRAAEAGFERILAREYLANSTVIGYRNVWELFTKQDADTYAYALAHRGDVPELDGLLRRHLKVRIVEFRQRDLLNISERSRIEYNRLLHWASIEDWEQYAALLKFEDEIAAAAGCPPGSVVLDIPKPPSYADLENVLLPGRANDQEEPAKVLNYKDWIDSYNTHRSFVRIFGPRGEDIEGRVWQASKEVLAARHIEIPDTARLQH